MKFSFLYWTSYTTDYPVEQQFQEVLELARTTRDTGFDMFVANHSYLRSSLRALQPLPMLARLAPETGEMALCTGIFLLALHNPVEVAEQLATLDVISEGRLVFGIGVGTPDLPWGAFGVDPASRGDRVDESIRVIKGLWTEDVFNFQGRHFSLKEARCIINPVQKPHPPIWIGATADRAISRAARLGDAWYPGPNASLTHTENGLAFYRRCLEEYGRPAPAVLPFRRDMYIAADQETAKREGGQYLGGPMSLWKGVDYDPDLYFMGSPESVVEEIGRYGERLGDLNWVFRVQWPGLPHNKVMEQVELLASRVLPHFR